MKKLSEAFEEKSKFERMAMIVTILLSVCVLTLSFIGILGIMAIDITNFIAIPMLGVVTLLNGLVTFKKNKLTGTIVLISASFIFICCIAVFATRFVIV